MHVVIERSFDGCYNSIEKSFKPETQINMTLIKGEKHQERFLLVSEKAVNRKCCAANM